jgi:uncharacterized membrane protein
VVARDLAAGVTVAIPARSFPELLALGVGLIRRYGAGEPTVVQALLRLLSTVLATSTDDPDRWAAIEGQADLLTAAAERAVVEPADLDVVHAEAHALREDLAARRAGDRQRPREAAQPRAAPVPDRTCRSDGVT